MKSIATNVSYSSGFNAYYFDYNPITENQSMIENIYCYMYPYNFKTIAYVCKKFWNIQEKDLRSFLMNHPKFTYYEAINVFQPDQAWMNLKKHSFIANFPELLCLIKKLVREVRWKS